MEFLDMRRYYDGNTNTHIIGIKLKAARGNYIVYADTLGDTRPIKTIKEDIEAAMELLPRRNDMEDYELIKILGYKQYKKWPTEYPKIVGRLSF